MNDTECIDNNWYGLFNTRNGNVLRETLEVIPKRNIHTEKPPTGLCKDERKHLLVKEVIANLKVIDIDGETMQYILEQIGMDEQMHRQLVMKNDFGVTKDILREKFELSL